MAENTVDPVVQVGQKTLTKTVCSFLTLQHIQLAGHVLSPDDLVLRDELRQRLVDAGAAELLDAVCTWYRSGMPRFDPRPRRVAAPSVASDDSDARRGRRDSSSYPERW